jgi:AcrR family transcriptional regulator
MLDRVNTVPYGATMSAKLESHTRNAGERIGPDDWVRGALSVLLREGIAGVRVEPLAARLGVTKGSFYWHFADRGALHAAMLEHWRTIATRDIILRVERVSGGPRAKLRHLIAMTAGREAARLETAMRGWARQDASVAEAIGAADRERIAYVAGLLSALGVKPAAADLRARILYLAVIGSYFSQAERLPAGRRLWREIENLIS